MAIPRISKWASVRLPWPRFQPPPLKFRTAGFPQYGFKFQAPLSSAESLPMSVDGLSGIPTYATFPHNWLSPSESPRPEGIPPQCAGLQRLTTPPGPRGPRSGEFFHGLTLIACRPHPPVWFPPVHFPAEPVIGTVFDIQGSSCLDSRPSELLLLGSPGLPPSTSAGRSDTGTAPSFRIGTGHRIERRNSWHLQYSA